MLRLCEHFSTTAKTLVCYQDFSSYKHKAQHCEACCGKINSTSAKPNTVNYDISSIIFDGELLWCFYNWTLSECVVESLQSTEIPVDLSNFSNQDRKNGSVPTTRESRTTAIAGIDSSFFPSTQFTAV